MSTQTPNTNAGRKGYETRDVLFGPVVMFTIAIVLLVLFTFLGIACVMDDGEAPRGPRHPMADLRERPRGPLLQAQPSQALREYQAGEEELLTTYGWVDPQGGVVRVPIERALDMALERGFPTDGEEEGR